ncbi:uncharacterized protein LOC135814987 [Sycon ciliatum]|uniref:uncharacterized protein LOC135814987 n=1 Tax=Sycon ciliatum TaxID=27933 RepID=UPI0031F6B94A
MDAISQIIQDQSGGDPALKPNLQLCIDPSTLPDVEESEVDRTPVTDALRELEGSHRPPASELDVPIRLRDVLPSQVKKLFPEGLAGGNVTIKRSFGGRVAPNYMFEVDFRQDRSEERIERLRPPSIDKDAHYTELRSHVEFEPSTRLPSEHSKRCLECIFKKKDRAQIKAALQRLFLRDSFRRAAGRFHCMLQYHFVATCLAFLCDWQTFKEYSTQFRDPIDLRAFLVSADILPFLQQMVNNQTPTHMEVDEEVPWQWYTVRSYALLLLMIFVSPARKQLDRARSDKEVANALKAAKQICKGGVIHSLMPMLGNNMLSVMETSYAVTLIQHLCDTVHDGLHDVLISNGIRYFSRLFTSGRLGRKVEEMEMDCVGMAEKFFLSLPIDNMKLVSSSVQVTESRLRRAWNHVALIRQMSGSLVVRLMCMSDLTRQHALALPGPVSCMHSVIRCLRQPYQPSFGLGRGVINAASQLLLAMVEGSHDLAHELLENEELTTIFVRWLLAPYRWPVDNLLACISEMLKGRTAECPCFREIESSTPILEACGLYLYCSNQDVQANAHYIVIELCKTEPRHTKHLMNMDLISPKLYKEKILPMLSPAAAASTPEFPILEHQEAWQNKDEQLEDVFKIGDTEGMSKLRMKEQGEKHFAAGTLTESYKWFTSAFLTGPHVECNTAILRKRAEIYYGWGQYDKALQDCTLMISFDFDDKYSWEVVRALNLRARCFQRDGRLFEACNDMLRCVYEMPAGQDYIRFFFEVAREWRNISSKELEKHVVKNAAGTPLERCAKCSVGKPDMPRCSRCKVMYCSLRCQRSHWTEHKSRCEAVSDKAYA